MDWPFRIRTLPLAAALSTLVGCASGDTGSGFTSLTSFGNMDTGQLDTGDATAGTGGETVDPDTVGVMTSNATGDTGSDPDSGSGPDPDTGPDPDAGCVPDVEVCDGIDNDCDTVADNGNPEGGQA